MEIVINLSEEDYSEICKCTYPNDILVGELIHQVRNNPPRARGHWIYLGEENEEETKAGNFHYSCSVCSCSDIHGKSIEIPYCWNCGAKMDEKN